MKGDQEAFNRKFGGYMKNNIDPANITNMFNDIKNKIIGA